MTSRPNQHPGRSGWAVAAAVVVLAALGAGCSSGAGKSSTANGQAPAASATEKAAAAATDKAPMPAATEPFARLDPATFAEHMGDKGAVLINVHVPYEGELEHTNAFIPYDHIVGDTRLPKDKDTEVLLYCRSGRMSEIAANALHTAGYTRLAHLEGGMRGWETAGRKLLQNPAHATETSVPHPM